MHELIKKGNCVRRDVSILSKNINAKKKNKIFLVKVKDAMNTRATYSSKRMPALHSVSLCNYCTRRRTGIEVVEVFLFVVI